MENNLFNGLQVVSGDLKTTLLNEYTDISVTLRGEVELSRGNFQQSFTYWVSNCETTRFGYVDCDDFDWNEQLTKLGGLPIDSIHQLRQTLENSGLRTLSQSLEFGDSEKRQAIFSAVESSKGFKKQFGKNAKFWRVLTDAQQKLVRLNYVIENFDTSGDYDKRQFGIKGFDENNEEIKHYTPTLVELSEYRDSILTNE
jgi:predicted mannosyl-3-phosphoglycerate phosphatase (HAD superfamily)